MPNVLIIHRDGEFARSVLPEFEAAGLLPIPCMSSVAAMGMILSEPPDVIIADAEHGNWEGLRLCETVKHDTAFTHISLIALMPPGTLEQEGLVNWEEPPFDDCLEEPTTAKQLVRSIQLCLARKRRHLDANPLTRLPGNNTIMHELEKRMAAHEEFAVGYIDLDNFKAFNDKYGFSRGDEALRMTARLLMALVSKVGFVGHIGGDDFVFIVPVTKAATISGQIVDHFDHIIASLYDEEDRARGSIVSKNRKGETETFPIMTISIAVIPNRNGRLQHLGQISAIAAELKKQAKQAEGSTFVIDRRG